MQDYPSHHRGAAIGARLRRLSERIDREANAIYAEMDIEFEQRWFGVLNQLALSGPMSVGELAAVLGVAAGVAAVLVAVMLRIGQAPDALLYSNLDLREAIAFYYRATYGVSVAPEQIIVTSGALTCTLWPSTSSVWPVSGMASWS